MMYVKAGIAVVIIYCLYLLWNSGVDTGFNRADTACKSENIQELEDKNAKIVALTAENNNLRASGDKASVKIASGLNQQLKEVRNERDEANARASAATDALRLRLDERQNKDGLGGDGDFAVTSSGECNGAEIARRTREVAEGIIEAQGRHAKTITEIASESDSNTRQLGAAQKQLLLDREKKAAIDEFLKGE